VLRRSGSGSVEVLPLEAQEHLFHRSLNAGILNAGNVEVLPLEEHVYHKSLKGQSKH